MEVRMVNTPSADSNNEPVACYVAIELSKSGWLVGFLTPLSDKTSRYQVKAGDAQALLDLIERVHTRVARQLNRPVEVMSCYEAGYDGFWLHRVLEAHGIHNHVLDPASLQVNRRARQAKTDRIDVDRMLRALIRYLRGEPEACSVVQVPRVEEEMPSVCIASASAWSPSVCSMSIASKGFVRHKASITTRRCGLTVGRSSTNCALAMDVRYPRASSLRSYVSLSVWSSCSR